jgi:glycosyltransferase involved in cell wall biosynthesis
MEKDCNHFLLVYMHLRTGGIETLIVRMANWLILKGYSVTVLLKEPGELLNLLNPNITVDILDSKNEFFFSSCIKKKYLPQYHDKDIDYIYSYGPQACYLASFIYKYSFAKKKPIFINGIYHPHEFALEGGISFLDRFHIELYNKYIAGGSKFFMSQEVRKGNEPILGEQVPDSIIWPLPIDDSQFHNVKRNIVPFKIVSIGRLANFKTYNIYMFDVIEELLKNGYNVTWDVYGDGPLEDEMRNIIKERELSQRVFMKGVLPYSDCVKALSVAHVFVGMGTSLIEAGFSRVPSISAIADDNVGLTYGALYNLPYYACGEPLSDEFKTYPVTYAIRQLFDMAEKEYEAEAELTFQYVQPYAIDKLMHKFVDYANAAPKKQNIEAYPNWKYILYCICTYYMQYKKKIGLRKRFQGRLR